MNEFEAYFGDLEQRKYAAQVEFDKLVLKDALLHSAVTYGLSNIEIIVLLMRDRHRLIDQILKMKFEERPKFILEIPEAHPAT